MNIKDMQGQIFNKVIASEDELIFRSDTHRFRFYHQQNCCENVIINDINGDLKDLEGTTMIVAEERNNVNEPPIEGYVESYTWTFYEFRTSKGSVTVRWYGASNGYYSESVNLEVTSIASQNAEDAYMMHHDL